ncbi:MAG TPA: helix-turn-helix domain-containing protein [Phototrophicaceae bacterium]|nr:helix-turn-helix domain-containing protein [Phototrophicaceae bacterium]
MSARIYEERPSDSPYIEKIGRFYVEGAYSHTCPADVSSNILIVKYKGKSCFSVWGPEIKAGLMCYPDDTEFLFIRFKLGSFMPHFCVKNLVNTGIILPQANGDTFWLDGSAWQIPNYENVDTFIEWLVGEGLLVHDPVVDDVVQAQPHDLSLRSAQRRLVQATGLTLSTITQIERARHALTLLERGVSILDTVFEAGYFDQSHLTRSMRQFVGQTPAQIARANQPE